MIGPAAVLSGSVLIVDDQPANVSLLERMLRGAGYTCVSSTLEPREVCELHRRNRYDLIVLDLQMPGLDGFQVMQGLKEVETEGYLPVLVLTAQPEHRRRALSAGAKDFVSKPFDQVEVLTRIHNLLEVRLLLRESRRHGELLERYDPLTGLPNRTLYRELLARTLGGSGGGRAVVSVLFVAIDRFKNVNEALGRVVGDAVLCRVADRLRGCIGPMDTVARLGGDEFGLIVATAGAAGPDARMMVNRVREALRAPLDLAGPEVAVTASIGIVLSPADSTDADGLMKFADTALHRAKDAGRDTYRFYSMEMNARAQGALDVENALRNALERGEFVLHYQPKMRIDTGAWSGVEALIRWERPGYGLVAPLEFIPVLEETGLIVPAGSWVIEEACRQIAEWAGAGIGWVRVAVNVSPRQFLRDGFVPHVARVLAGHGIAPALLEIEITESCLLAPTQEVDDVLRDLRALGISISIDDFGTGYSSLAYLKRFPIDTLKIDITFIRDITTSPSAAAIAVAIVQMARCLNMKVVAEGVDTAEQLEFLREQSCDEIQGYYCARPMTAAELAQRVNGAATLLGGAPHGRAGAEQFRQPSVS